MNQNNNEQQNKEPQNSQQPQYILMQNSMPQGLQPQLQQQDEIDLKEIWNAVWAGKWLIIGITFLFTFASIVYAINQPNIYKASTLLAPASSDGGAGGLAALAGQFSGLASMAGISLGEGKSDKTGLALEILKSRVFIEKFIKKNQLKIPLMAAKNWDMETNTIIHDQDIYNDKEQKWVRDVKPPQQPEPSSWETYETFKEIFSVSQNDETGMVTFTIEYFSPIEAEKWLTLLVTDINEFIRTKDKTEAENSISFLTQKLEQTDLMGMQTVFYQLIEEQTKTMMLAEVSNEYVLKTIDPPNSPDEEEKPKRLLICVFGTLIGGFFSLIIALVRHYF